MDPFELMLLVTIIAGAVTGVGALPVFFRTTVSHRLYDSALGLAGGIMIAASIFGLMLPGMDAGSLTAVITGLLLGGFTLLLANKLLPHIQARFGGWTPEGGASITDLEAASRVRRAALIGGAIVLHNAPEGLAMGVAFASGLEEVALMLAIVIGVQNIPDGFAFAVPLGDTGLSNPRILLYTTFSGLLPQVAAALFGYGVVAIATGIFPIAAGFAAGAMIAVVIREMIPASHGHGYADAATATFLIGFIILVIVDVAIEL